MYYKYKVIYYDNFKEDEMPDEGIVYGKNYGEAAQNVFDDYNDNDYIVSMFLEEVISDGNMCINKNDIQSYFE